MLSLGRTIFVKGSHFPPTVPWPTMTTLPLAVPLAGDPLSEKTSTEMDFWKSEVILSSILDPNDDSDVNGDSFKDTANRMQVGPFFLLANRMVIHGD